MTTPTPPQIPPAQQTEIQAAVLRKLLAHLRAHPEVQNIKLMNLAYFCRNCLAKWTQTAAAEHGITLDYDQAREIIYGMPYPEYRDRHAQPASKEDLQKFETAQKKATE